MKRSEHLDKIQSPSKIEPLDPASHEDSKSFSTADIGQAAYLMAHGHRFLGAENAGRDRVVFKFADNGRKAGQAALEFANNGMVAGKTLLEAMRFLKSILRDARPKFNQSEGANMNVKFDYQQ